MHLSETENGTHLRWKNLVGMLEFSKMRFFCFNVLYALNIYLRNADKLVKIFQIFTNFQASRKVDTKNQ